MASVEWVKDLEYRGSKIYVYRTLDSERSNIDGVKFDFTVNMKLSFRYPRVGYNGYDTELLTSGRFKVFAHLVLEPEEGEQPILLTPGVHPLEGEIKRDNTLQLDYKVVAPYYPSMGNIKLVLKVIPLGMEYSLKPMDRRFTIGPYTSLVGKRVGLLEDRESREGRFNFDEYILSAISGDQAYKVGFVDKAQEFRFGTISVKFATIEAGETASQRTVVFKVSSKVTDKTVSRPAGDNVPFEVISLHDDYQNLDNKNRWKFMRITNSEKIDDPTRTRDGEIFWYDTVTHKYYAKEELLSRRFFYFQVEAWGGLKI